MLDHLIRKQIKTTSSFHTSCKQFPYRSDFGQSYTKERFWPKIKISYASAQI